MPVSCKKILYCYFEAVSQLCRPLPTSAGLEWCWNLPTLVPMDLATIWTYERTYHMPVSYKQNITLLFWGHFSTLPASADLRRPWMILKVTNNGSIGFGDHFILWKDISHACVLWKKILYCYFEAVSQLYRPLPASAGLKWCRNLPTMVPCDLATTLT